MILQYSCREENKDKAVVAIRRDVDHNVAGKVANKWE